MGQKKIGFIVRIVLALLLIVFIAQKIINQSFWEDLQEINFIPKTYIFLIVAVILMPLNWSLEARKWQIVMKSLKAFSFWQALKSVLAGISTGLVTPNRIGNFIGRTYKLEKAIKTKAVFLTFLTNLAQFITSIAAGIIGLLIVGIDRFDFSPIWTIFIGAFILALSVCVYFVPKIVYINRLHNWYPNKIKEGIRYVQDSDSHQKVNILVLSMIRYFIFITQYVLVVSAFDQQLDIWELVALIMVVYLVMTITPSLLFGKLLVREGAALLVLGTIGISTPIVLLSGFFIWFINLAIPSFVGGSILFSKK